MQSLRPRQDAKSCGKDAQNGGGFGWFRSSQSASLHGTCSGPATALVSKVGYSKIQRWTFDTDQRVQGISHTRHPSSNTPGESHHSAQITDQEVAVHQRSGTSCSALRVLEVQSASSATQVCQCKDPVDLISVLRLYYAPYCTSLVCLYDYARYACRS